MGHALLLDHQVLHIDDLVGYHATIVALLQQLLIITCPHHVDHICQ